MSQDKRTTFNAQISEEAAEWFVEFRLGEIDAAGRREFDSWIRTSPEHLRAYLETAALWNEGTSLSVHRDLDSDELIALAGTEGNIIPLSVVPPQTPTQAPSNQLSASVLQGGMSLDGAPERNGGGPGLITDEHGKFLGLLRPAPVKPPLREQRVSSRWPVSLAAAIALTVGGSALIVFWQLGRDTVYATAVGERRTLTLEDGSTVELNARSRIRVHFAPNQRNVELLEGQVLFHVAKDPQRTFIVRSDQLRVRAIGTQFDVNRKTTGTTVTVVEGRVAVYRAGTPELGTLASATAPPQLPVAQDTGALTPLRSRSSSNNPTASVPVDSPLLGNPASAINSPGGAGSAAVFLSAGEQLTLSDQTSQPQSQHANPTVATAWTQGQLVLDSVMLADVADEFNRYSTRRLIIEDRGEHPLRLSGVFATDPQFLLNYLRQRPDITVQETPTEIRIIRHD